MVLLFYTLLFQLKEFAYEVAIATSGSKSDEVFVKVVAVCVE